MRCDIVDSVVRVRSVAFAVAGLVAERRERFAREVLRAVGRDFEVVLDADLNAYSWPHANISPDGQWIAFETDHTGQSDLWIVRRDGSDLQSVANSGEWERGPIWRP